MRSEKLYKGYKKMYKDDIINLKFILSLLGLDFFNSSKSDQSTNELTMTGNASHFDKHTRF